MIKEQRIVNISGIKHVPSMWTLDYDKEKASVPLPTPSGTIKEVTFAGDLTEEELILCTPLPKEGSKGELLNASIA